MKKDKKRWKEMNLVIENAIYKYHYIIIVQHINRYKSNLKRTK